MVQRSYRSIYVIGENYIYMSPFFLLCCLGDTVGLSQLSRWVTPSGRLTALSLVGLCGFLLRVSAPAALMHGGVSVVLVPEKRQADKVLTGGGSGGICRVKEGVRVL